MLLRRIFSKLFYKTSIYDFFMINFRNPKEVKIQNPEKPKIYFMLLPNYGNLGDQAIFLGTREFLTLFFPSYEIVYIDLLETFSYLKSIKKHFNYSKDIILLQGGGNFGDVYYYIEKYRRGICRALPKAKIVSMPVTSTFTTDKERKKSQWVYGKCSNLTIFAREIYSFEYLKKHFPKNRIYLVPDIAFFLYYIYHCHEDLARASLLLCLRSDKESAIKDQRVKLIQKWMPANDKAFIIDSIVDRIIPDELREQEVLSFIRTLKSAKCVITDRMHAMVLCAITNTPCIVMASSDWKIKGTYVWIEKLKQIQFVNSSNEITESLINSVAASNCKFDTSILDEFTKIKDALN